MKRKISGQYYDLLDSITYIVKKTSSSLTLRYAKVGNPNITLPWRGKTLVHIEDDGNGLTVHVEEVPPVYLDYSQVHSLYMALCLYHKKQPHNLGKIV